jgi:hypothetical protein
MPSNVDARSDTTLAAKELSVSYSDSIIGAAIFDLSGLPKEYFTTTDSSDIVWVQTIFQALGLQSLLTSSLRLEGFRHAIVHGKEYRAIVVRQKARYTALLLQHTDADLTSEEFIQWAIEFDPAGLRAHPRFNVV